MTSFQPVPVSENNLRRFIDYCKTFGKEHDESFIPEKDFAISPDQPSYLLTSENQVVGAVSLLRSENYLQARKGRFAIFHTQTGAADAYQTLHQAITPHFSGLDQTYLFIPENKPEISDILHSLGYHPERIAYVLCLDDPQEQPIDLPAQYRIQPVLEEDIQAQITFQRIINQNLTPEADQADLMLEEVKSWFKHETYLPGGVSLLWFAQQPVGGICVFRDDEYETEAFVAYLGVNKEHRGKGLGRKLLRWSINIALSNGLKPVFLSVRGENETATRLYQSEGFRVVDSRVCFTKQITQ